MLSRVMLPGGAQRLSQAPADAPALRGLPARPAVFLNATVLQTRFYRTTAPVVVVIARVRAGLPQHTTAMRGGASSNAGYVYPAIDPGRLGMRQLSVQTTTTTDARGTVVRIDVEVQSIAERLPSQAIPTTARVVDIVRPADHAVIPGRRIRRLHIPALSLTVTRPAQVMRLARDVNLLPFANASRVFLACTEAPMAPTVTFTFRARAHGRALATVSASAATPELVDPCLAAPLTVHGQKQRALLEAGVLLKHAGALLGVTLTTPY